MRDPYGFRLLPGHAHLAIIGWLSLWVSATIYGAIPALEKSVLARIHAGGFIVGAGSVGLGHVATPYFYPHALIFVLAGAFFLTLGLLAFLVRVLRYRA